MAGREDALARRPPAARLGEAARVEPGRPRALLHRAFRAELRHRLRYVPARLLHDEVQPEGRRSRGVAARVRDSAPAGPPRGRARHAAHPARAASGPRRGHRPARGQPRPGRRGAGRAGWRADDHPCPRGSRRTGDASAHPGARLGARHEPGDRGDGGLHRHADPDRRRRLARPRDDRERARRDRRGGDGDRAEHPRAVGAGHRGGRGPHPRRRRLSLRRRREPQRDHGPGALRRPRLRRRAPQPPQELQHAARRRRPGLRACLLHRRAGPVPPGPDRGGGRRGRRTPRDARAQHRTAPAVPRQRRRADPRLRLHAGPRRRGAARGLRPGRAQRQLPARADARPLRPALRPPGAARGGVLRHAAAARARRAHLRHREAAHRPRVPPADGLLPVDRRGGPDDGADRDGAAQRRSRPSPRR